jgi:hypothetical protein
MVKATGVQPREEKLFPKGNNGGKVGCGGGKVAARLKAKVYGIVQGVGYRA